MVKSKRRTYCKIPWERVSNLGCSEIRLWWQERLPILEWGPKYNLHDNLLADTVAGMMLAVHQVVQGLAFAIMSSVHPVFGLYGSLFPPLIYAIFGMGRHVSTGTFAITSLISAGAVERLVSPTNVTMLNSSLCPLGLSDFEMQRIGVAAAVTFLGGIIQLSLGLLHLGSATLLLSEPVVSSMTTGAATHVVTSQVKYLLGMKMPYISGPLGMFYIYHYIIKNINMVQLEVLLSSICCLAVLIVVKDLNERFKNKIKCVIPIELILIITTSLACCYADMESAYDIPVVGYIPKGIPPPWVPSINILSDVVTEAFGVALVGYTVSIFIAYNSAKKFKYFVDENQELFAHGLTNVISSFLLCIPNAGAPARLFVLYNNGAKTQVACLISCILILLVIYFIAPLLYWLPMCVLASIIIVSLKGMLIQFRDLKKYWNMDKIDCVIWVCTYLVTICFAANIGLFFGVVFSLALGLFRLTRAKTLQSVNLDEDYSEIINKISAEFLKTVKIVTVSSPLFFLNAKKFYTDFMKLNTTFLRGNDHKHKTDVLLRETPNDNSSVCQPQTMENKSIILDCSGITFFDFMGISMLTKICLELKGCGTNVLLARCDVSLVKALQSSELGTTDHHFFDSVNSALSTIQPEMSHELNWDALVSSDV